MRKLWINLLVPALLLGAATIASSQPPAPDPDFKPDSKQLPAKDKEAPSKSKLEQMLEIALKHNPDLRVAETKAREADAEVDRARMAVTRKVVLLYNGLETARANVSLAEKRAKRLQALAARGGASAEDLDEAQAKLLLAKAELAKLEAEIPFLLGQQNIKMNLEAFLAAVEKTRQEDPNAAVANALRYLQHQQSTIDSVGAITARELAFLAWMERAHLANSPMSDKIRAALDKPMTFEFTANGGKGGDHLERFLTILRKTNPDFIFNNKVPDQPGVSSVKFEAVPLGAILQWLEDDLSNDRIVVRDYGLLLVPRDKAPADAVLLHDFWKAKQKDAPKAKEEKK